jgi:hypothetical protein
MSLDVVMKHLWYDEALEKNGSDDYLLRVSRPLNAQHLVVVTSVLSV